MEAIKIILALIMTVALSALVVGVVMLLIKKWRPKGKRIALISFVTVIVAPAISMGLDGIANKQEQATHQAKLDEQARGEGFTDYADKLRSSQELLDQKAREAGYKDHEARLTAERQAKAIADEEARLKALNGFPDEKTQQTASSVGISRYEAFKLLKDETVIARYCAYSTQANILEQDKHSQMDAVQSEDAKNAIWDKYEKLQKQLIDNLNNDTGMVDLEYVQASIAGHWSFYCRAAEDNWSVITEEQAKATTRSDAKEAKDGLNAFYLLNLNEETSPFFSKQRYSAVSCDWENHNNMRFVGCQLASLSYKSKWQMFLVGRLDNGRLAVNPINGDTSGKLDVTQARFYDEASGKHVFIQAYEQPRAYLAEYAGARIDIKAVRELFE